MWFRSLIESVSNRTLLLTSRRKVRSPAPKHRPARRLCLECLEDRRLFCNDIAPVHLPLLARSEAALGRVPAHEALPQAWTPFAPRGVVAREAALASTSVPSLTISDVTRVEGNSGQAAFVFTVSL